VFVPNGAIVEQWSPSTAGANFEFAPILKPLERFRDSLVVVSNLTRAHPGVVEGDHAISAAGWLSGVLAKRTQAEDVQGGTTIDQIVAERIGQDTPFPSLELATADFTGYVGACTSGYSCVYTNTIAWSSPTTPLPMEINPRVVFERLFGRPGTPEQRAARTRRNLSILDLVRQQAADLQRGLGARDRVRLGEYLDNIREIERRIQRVEARNASGEQRALPDAPIGVPDSFEEHVHILMDLIAVAFASDSTRVFSFKLGRDASGRSYPESGVTTGFHNASHHGEREDRIMDFAKINRYHVSMLPYLMGKLKNTPEGDSNLLENSLLIYGSPMGDSNIHNHKRVPLVVMGHAGGKLTGGVHIKAPDGTPMANAMFSTLHALGRTDLQSFGDSSGLLDLNTNPVIATDAKG
jgi:hypothetical protein